uniref:serine/threonine protein kinase n=1 Tax=Prevotella sp. TaxID=59823 RepID=UPI004027BFEC
MQQLQQGVTLQNGKYAIVRVLGQGGFGITYLAIQTTLNRKVAIKEFFMNSLCTRKDSTIVSVTEADEQADVVERYMKKFIKEAQILARFDNPNIVHVQDVFKENNTWYYVMEYVDGRSLDRMIREKGHLSEDEASNYIRKVAHALQYIHSYNVNHLDIKPSNIMVRSRDNEPILIDFGISKQYDENKNATTTTPPGISEGYSPLEQYKAGGVSVFSPQSDIYALGATLYCMVTGKTPPNATDILNEGVPKPPASVSAAISDAITASLQPKKLDRPSSVEAFLSILDNKQYNDKRTVITDKALTAKNLHQEAEDYYSKHQVQILTEYGYFKMKKERVKSVIWICCISSLLIIILLSIKFLGPLNVIGWIILLALSPLALLPGMYLGPMIVGIRDKSLMEQEELKIHQLFIERYIKEKQQCESRHE